MKIKMLSYRQHGERRTTINKKNKKDVKKYILAVMAVLLTFAAGIGVLSGSAFADTGDTTVIGPEAVVVRNIDKPIILNDSWTVLEVDNVGDEGQNIPGYVAYKNYDTNIFGGFPEFNEGSFLVCYWGGDEYLISDYQFEPGGIQFTLDNGFVQFLNDTQLDFSNYEAGESPFTSVDNTACILIVSTEPIDFFCVYNLNLGGYIYSFNQYGRTFETVELTENKILVDARVYELDSGDNSMAYYYVNNYKSSFPFSLDYEYIETVEIKINGDTVILNQILLPLASVEGVDYFKNAFAFSDSTGNYGLTLVEDYGVDFNAAGDSGFIPGMSSVVFSVYGERANTVEFVSITVGDKKYVNAEPEEPGTVEPEPEEPGTVEPEPEEPGTVEPEPEEPAKDVPKLSVWEQFRSLDTWVHIVIGVAGFIVLALIILIFKK